MSPVVKVFPLHRWCIDILLCIHGRAVFVTIVPHDSILTLSVILAVKYLFNGQLVLESTAGWRRTTVTSQWEVVIEIYNKCFEPNANL